MRTPGSESGEASAAHIDYMVGRADLEAERTIAWTRIAVGVALLIVVLLTTRRLSMEDFVVVSARQITRLTLFVIIVSGVVTLLIIRAGYFREWMSYVLVAIDAALMGFALATTLHIADLSANFLAISPGVWAIPVMLAVGTLRYRPNVQIFFIFALILSLGLAAYFEDFVNWPVEPPPEGVNRFLTLPAYVVRIAFIVTAGFVGVLVMLRARRLLYKAVGETLQRATLTRFLPAEVTPLVASGRFAELRRGRRQHAVILFVDIRKSTTLAEGMDPSRLSIFIASFRRRVMASAQAFGGVIDKFIGDGAMIVFGLPEPRADDAARALHCARDLLNRIQRWNDKRGFTPPLQIGIGVHVGDVYFGVVGDRHRMELTVIGDTVNVAARLEQATKDYGVPLIASQAVVAEACAQSQWREVGREPLRGRNEMVTLMAPIDAQPADSAEHKSSAERQSQPLPTPASAPAGVST